MPEPRLPFIAVVSINRDKYSETFIQGAFDALPFRKVLLYGGYLPTHVTQDWRVEGEELPNAVTPFWKKKPQSPLDQATANLRRWLKANKPDAVLCNYGPSGVMLTALLHELRIPMVVHFHGYDAYRADILQSYGKDYPQLFSSAAGIVASSAHMREQLIGLGAPPHKVHTCIYGIRLEDFQERPMPDGPFTCLFVGRFVAKKRPLMALEAMRHLRDSGRELHLRMVGEGELLESCKSWAKENGLESSVEFLGALPPDAVAAEMGRAHVVLIPSLTAADGDSEGTPLVLMEAAACGRPVIAFRTPGSRMSSMRVSQGSFWRRTKEQPHWRMRFGPWKMIGCS
ncbi:MAG: glycosyltransferase [Bacteroidia bacterium]